LDHVTPSAAQFNTEKLNWLNAHYIKEANIEMLAGDIAARLTKSDVEVTLQPKLQDVLGLYRERANNLNQLAKDIAYFYSAPTPSAEDIEKHITPEIVPILQTLRQNLANIDWTAEAIHHEINEVVTQNALKFPKVAMPLRIVLTGTAQSPSIDQVMALLGKEEALARIQAALKA
jgi:glutamyl-tRNA synthetase